MKDSIFLCFVHSHFLRQSIMVNLFIILAIQSVTFIPVFFSSEDLLSKTILKKIVPHYLATERLGCEVVIKDMTRDLIIPSVPDMNTFSQDAVNSFLKENAEEVANGVLITRYL